MKKLFFFATALAALASCSNNDVIEDVTAPEVAINFSAETTKATRGAIDSNSDLADNGGFYVWGYKTSTATPDWTNAQTIFDQVNVYALTNGENGAYIDGEDTNWTYDGTRHWDVNGTYKFYAVAPKNTTATDPYSISGAANAKMITISGAKYGKIGDTTLDDFLLWRAGEQRTGTNNDNVDITFNHVMAKVGLAVKRQSGITQEVTVDGITMTGWDAREGTFVQTSTSTPNTLSHDEWSQSGTAVAGSITFVGTGASQTAILLNDDAIDVVDQYIMVPQTISYDGINATGLTFTVNYTIKYSETDSETFDVVAVLPADAVWGTDSYTKYTLTIGPDPIKFDVNAITDWTNQETSVDVTVK